MSAHRRWAVLLPCLSSGSGVPQSLRWVGPGGALSVAGCHRAAVGLTLRSLACPLEVSPEWPIISRAPSWGPVLLSTRGHVCRLPFPPAEPGCKLPSNREGTSTCWAGVTAPHCHPQLLDSKDLCICRWGGHPASLAARVSVIMTKGERADGAFPPLPRTPWTPRVRGLEALRTASSQG